MDIEDLGNFKICTSVISCSRKTDVPAHYMSKYSGYFKDGYIDVLNPYTHSKKRVQLDPNSISIIMWWSKNYRNWINEFLGNIAFWSQYVHCFQFTINSDSELEPNLDIKLPEKLKQLEWLVNRFGVDCMNVRVDPIVFYENIGIKMKHIPSKTNITWNNLGDFEKIVKKCSELNIPFINTSLCIPYPKVVKRMKKLGFILRMESISKAEKNLWVNYMVDICDKYGVELRACADSELPKINSRIQKAKCVDGKQLSELLETYETGTIISTKSTPTRTGCKCTWSIDIGEYLSCRHGCAYCYAHPI